MTTVASTSRIVASVREFVGPDGHPTAPALEHADHPYRHTLVARRRELGLFGAPVASGGLGPDAMRYAVVIEECSGGR